MTDIKKTSLVILDDEANILNACMRLFRNEAFAVFTTTDHKEALRVIETQDIKVVLSDQRMPDISGVEFLRQVKERSLPSPGSFSRGIRISGRQRRRSIKERSTVSLTSPGRMKKCGPSCGMRSSVMI